MKFLITLEGDEDGFIVASCSTLPGCHSQGRDRKEAVANVTEAIQAYIESMVKHGEPVPGYSEFQEIEVDIWHGASPGHLR